MAFLLITAGDPYGIGPEIILKYFQPRLDSRLRGNDTERKRSPEVKESAIGRRPLTVGRQPSGSSASRGVRKWIPLVVGSARVFQSYARRLNLPFPFQVLESDQEVEAHRKSTSDRMESIPRPRLEEMDKKPLLFDMGHGFPFEETQTPGPCSEGGAQALAILEKACTLVDKGLASALVTCPVSKKAIQASENKPSFQGHTEYLQERFLKSTGRKTWMMLVHESLRLTLVTNHLPLKEVPRTLTQEKVEETIRITHSALQRLWLVEKPKVGVCALNPHAGEEGLFGAEEALIRQAIQKTVQEGIRVSGPFPADTLLWYARQGRYDGVVTLYHDQALIPIKVLAGFHAVNLTLGLPFLRVSPVHGTAFDVAGQGVADPGGLQAAVHLLTALFASSQR